MCGCQCTRCCYNADPNNCTTLLSGSCNSDDGFTCLEKNSSRCGVQFSSGQQSSFCSIPYPSNWPALVNTPEPAYRLAGKAPATSILVTAVTQTLASGLGSKLVNQLVPAASSGDLIKLKTILDGDPSKNISGIYATNSTTGSSTFNGYVLSELGFQMGSYADPPGSYYISTSFLSSNETYVLLPSATCEAKGISQTQPIKLLRFLALYGGITVGGVNLSNASAPLFSLGSFSVLCTDTVVTPMASVSELDRQLYCGYKQSRCNGSSIIQEYAGAWDFADTTQSNFNPDIYYNSTNTQSNGNGPGQNMEIPALVNMAAKAWYRNFINGTSVVPPTSLLGVMSMPKGASKVSLDFSSLLGPLFYTWVVQLLFPTFLQQLVYEKEKRLRMMMKMHGLGDGAYWLITYFWYLVLYVVYIAAFIIFGAAVGLKYFRKNNIGIQIIFYFLHGQCMIAFAFMLSSLFSSALTAVVFAYLYVFASGLIGSLLLQTFMNKDPLWIFFVEWVPAWSLYRGLYELGAYAFLGVYKNEPGMQFKNLSDVGNGMTTTWAIFVVEWAIFMVLGWYFEQVISSGNGIRRHPLFFLDYFKKKKVQEGHAPDRRGSADGCELAIKAGSGELLDVVAEKQRVEALDDYSHTPIVMKDIRKVYPGQDGGKAKVAVKNLTLAIENGECFGLLGPNGAGKSTAINVLVGFLEATSGSAFVEGLDIKHDMQKVYKLMGVCPQHDLQWEQLTGMEHLLFYGRLKGMTKEELSAAVSSGLQSVNLLNVANKQSGQYSGGMRRRLSVAISFMGQPKVVYLDEPSTGLDPASRRGLWDVVRSNKQGRALILTTHSMEEAEILCDRLGIFVDGQLVCIGNPKEITSRYAGYLVFTITVPQHMEDAAKVLVTTMSPNAVLTYSLGGTLKYELPTSDISLSGVFAAINKAKENMTILDWGVANATLEEVFIKFARSTNMTSDDN